MTLRTEPVTTFGPSPPTGPLQVVLDILHAVFGKVVSLAVVTLLLNEGGFAVINAATGLGTALSRTRTTVDFQDAGVDSVRVVVRGENSAASPNVIVEVFNITASLRMAAATLVGTTEQTVESGWVAFAVNGGDEDIEVRVIGDGALDPILYAVHLQLRTTQARA